MSSRSYFYNKHTSRSKSYYGKKKMYGSAYQPGQTTKYQRYGRTMRLDPSYISIPRELPTRQSQLRQLEELRKAGLIPEPVPPQPLAELKSISFIPQKDQVIGSVGQEIYNGLRTFSLNGDIKTVSYSYTLQKNMPASSGYYNVGEIRISQPDNYYGVREFPYYRGASIFLRSADGQASTVSNLTFTVVYTNCRFVNIEDSSRTYSSTCIQFDEAYVIIYAYVYNNQKMYIYYDSANNEIPDHNRTSETTTDVPIVSGNWHELTKQPILLRYPNSNKVHLIPQQDEQIGGISQIANTGSYMRPLGNTGQSNDYIVFSKTGGTMSNNSTFCSNNGVVVEYTE